MALPAFSMFVEYKCEECDFSEIEIEIIPKYKCPICKQLCEVNEEVSEEEKQ